MVFSALELGFRKNSSKTTFWARWNIKMTWAKIQGLSSEIMRKRRSILNNASSLTLLVEIIVIKSTTFLKSMESDQEAKGSKVVAMSSARTKERDY